MSSQEQPPASGDELAIELGIWAADVEYANISDATAKMIASLLHSGQASAFYSLASCGAVDCDRVLAEMEMTYREPELPEQVGRWLGYIGLYAIEHEGRGPVAGWSKLWREIYEN